MEKLNFNALLSVYKKQQETFGEKVNLGLFYNYLNFRQTQWKKCNTTFKKMREDNKVQRRMLLNGNIHLIMFYRTIQFAIFHELQLNSITKKMILVKPQKLANLPQEITYRGLVELCERLSAKMMININPDGLMELANIYLDIKKIENSEKSYTKLRILDLMVWNKTVAKNQELALDERMYRERKISLKTLYLSIQYLCEHILKAKLAKLKDILNFDTTEIKLHSRRKCKNQSVMTYKIESLLLLFAYCLNELVAEDDLAA